MNLIKRLIKTSLVLVALSLLVVSIRSTHTAQASSIVVNAPANGQTFTGNDFTVSGVADTNATILVQHNGLTLVQTRSDNTGAWSAHLSGLPDGNNTITVRSIKNNGYAIMTGGDYSSSVRIHQLRLSDNAVDPTSPYPISATKPRIFPSPSTQGTIFYLSGHINAADVPAKFDSDAPANPVDVTGNYPGSTVPVTGAFTADGLKYYSPDGAGSSVVSVVNTSTNAWVKDIDIGVPNIRSGFRGPSGKLYFAANNQVVIIDPANNDTVTPLDAACGVNQTNGSVAFSQDAAYPYYFSFCGGEAPYKVLKYRLSDNSLMSSFGVDIFPTSAVLNADNSKLYLSSSVLVGNNPASDKVHIIDTTTGAKTGEVTLATGAIGIAPSPDLEHLYVGVPGDGTHTGLDVIDMLDNSVTFVQTDDPILLIAANASASTLSNVSVAVVLGVKTTAATTAGTLAKTGVIVGLASPLGLFLVGAGFYSYYDYRRHKRPLMEATTEGIDYSYFHHLKVVSLPLLRYRLTFSVSSRVGERSDKITHI